MDGEVKRKVSAKIRISVGALAPDTAGIHKTLDSGARGARSSKP